MDPLIQLPENIAQLMSQGLGSALLGATKKVYEFVSEDEEWVLTLNGDFIALTANSYIRWEDFRIHLEKSCEALINIYNPSFFSRVGLRYINIIQKSVLGLESVSWDELLKPYVAGILTEQQLEGFIEENAHNLLFRLTNDLGHVRVRHGFVKDDSTKELCYLIDNDFFTEAKTEKHDVFRILTEFNKRSGRLFHWSITERLHEAMEPQPV